MCCIDIDDDDDLDMRDIDIHMSHLNTSKVAKTGTHDQQEKEKDLKSCFLTEISYYLENLTYCTFLIMPGFSNETCGSLKLILNAS